MVTLIIFIHDMESLDAKRCKKAFEGMMVPPIKIITDFRGGDDLSALRSL
jgi:hypothetical protein